MNKHLNPDTKTKLRAVTDLKKLIITLACAAASGLLFKTLGIPAPYLLGSMFGVWTVTAAIKPLRPHLGVPRWFHITVVLGLGVMIGAMFGPDTIEHMLNWIVTVSGMLVATVIATSAGYWYLTRWRGYDPALALFCAIPGGQAEVIVLSREFVDKDYVVALCHLVRVVVVFCSVPLVLALTLGEGAVHSSNVILSDLPSAFELPPMIIVQFVALALAGYSIARVIRTPVPFLVGPLFLSMGLHLFSVIEIPRMNEFVFLAQVTIGGTVGARLGQVEFKVLAVHLQDALVNVLLVLAVFVGCAYLMATLVGLKFLDVMLAFVPGGLYEVTLLSLIFGFDVAFVAIHHSTRMLFILFSLPLLLKLLRCGDQSRRDTELK
jgi:hypothetical protein